MPTTHAAMAIAITSRVETVLKPLLDASVELIYDNEDEKPTSDLWIRVALLPATSSQVDFGAAVKRFRRPGVLVFQTFSRFGHGTGAQEVIVGHIESTFRSKLVTGGYIWRTPSVQQLGRQERDDNSVWWQINVSCPFHVDDV